MRALRGFLRSLSSVAVERDLLAASRASQKQSWNIVASVCVERYPVTAPPLDDMQRRYKELVELVELENSLLSAHEVQLLEDRKRLEQRQRNLAEADKPDSEERIVTAQDFEDACLQELKAFEEQFMKECKDEKFNDDDKSLQRCPSRKLVLVVHSGTKKQWLLPEAYLKAGETLHQASLRAVSTLVDPETSLMPYGFAPAGFHKFKYPKPVAEKRNAIGEKIFFFKCKLKSANLQSSTQPSQIDYKWLTYDELPRLLPALYCKSVRKMLYE